MEVLSRMLKNTEMHAFMHVFRVGSNMAEGWSIYHLLLLMTPFFCCDASRLGLDNNYFAIIILEVYCPTPLSIFHPNLNPLLIEGIKHMEVFLLGLRTLLT